MTEELKRCPFCGGKAKLTTGYQNKYYTVVCLQCLSATGAQKTADKAVTAWNRRVSDA